MSTNASNFNRESICVTCLSQDRKLFSVNASEMCAKFYFKLSLRWTDKICWECYYMVKKMVAFKSRAQKAQAWLRSATNNHHESQCLSTLGKSTGLRLTIIGPDTILETTAPNPLGFVNVKEEMDFDESIESAVVEMVCKKENVSTDREVKQESIEDLGKKRKEEAVQTSSNTAKKKAKSPTPGIQAEVYTETTMTEEQMLEWWSKKRESKFFTQCIPSERCDTCIQPLDHLNAVKKHAARHTQLFGELECDICHQRALDERMLKFHKLQHYRLLQCCHCEFSWDNVNTMRQHCNDAHQIKQTLWDCEQCGRQFTYYNSFWKHLDCHSINKCQETLKKRRLIHRTKVQCKECGKWCWRSKIKIHMSTHSTKIDPAAYCYDCCKQFRDISLYKEHLKRKVHTGKSGKSRLGQEHRRRKFQCDKCSKKFFTKMTLQNHLVVHEANRTVYPCEQCGQSFKWKDTLYQHKLTKHEGKVMPRNLLCDYCGKAFLNKYWLAQHLNSHTGIRSYVCKLCGLAYRYESALYRHRRDKHKTQKNNNKTTILEANETIDDKNSENF